jgi:predicted transcriptional regulator YdeE
MTTDKIIKKIIGTFKDLQQRATEINSAHQQTVLATCVQKDKRGKYDSLVFYNVKTKKYALVFIRDYIARNVNHIPELDEMKNLVNNSIKS